MKPPHAVVQHAEHSYLLLEEGYNEDTRAVAFLAHPDNPLFAADDDDDDSAETARVQYAESEWTSVGRWTPTGLHLPDRHADRRELVDHLIALHLERTPRAPPSAWAVSEGEDFTGALHPGVPMGLLVLGFDDEERAAERADEAEGRQVVPIDHLGLFLHHAVRLGYSGALWNDQLPVFVCVDEENQLQFLRLARGQRSGVQMDLLTDEGWEAYEGAEKLGFFDNTEACDDRLVRTFGPQPVLDWPEHGALHSVGPREGVPLVLPADDDEPVRHGVLFTDRERADAYREEIDSEWIAFNVDDAADFVNHTVLEGCIVQLNPGSHRAHSGTLWSNGDDVVLDSFSGFWKLTADGFEATG